MNPDLHKELLRMHALCSRIEELAEDRGFPKTRIQRQRKALREANKRLNALRAEVDTLKRTLECSQQQAAKFMQTIDENNDRLTNAEARVWPGRTYDDDAPSIMAGEILDLRDRVKQLKEERDNAQSKFDTAESELLNDNMSLRDEIETLKEQMQDLNSRKAGE